MGTAIRSTTGPLLIAAAIVACGAVLVFTFGSPRPVRPTPPTPPTQSQSALPPPHERDLTPFLMSIHTAMPRHAIDPRMANFPPVAESVDMSRGFPVICVKYRGFLLAPVPHLSLPDAPFTPGQYEIILEFDSRVPHQPLIAVEITPDHVS